METPSKGQRDRWKPSTWVVFFFFLQMLPSWLSKEIKICTSTMKRQSVTWRSTAEHQPAWGQEVRGLLCCQQLFQSLMWPRRPWTRLEWLCSPPEGWCRRAPLFLETYSSSSLGMSRSKHLANITLGPMTQVLYVKTNGLIPTGV